MTEDETDENCKGHVLRPTFDELRGNPILQNQLDEGTYYADPRVSACAQRIALATLVDDYELDSDEQAPQERRMDLNELLYLLGGVAAGRVKRGQPRIGELIRSVIVSCASEEEEVRIRLDLIQAMCCTTGLTVDQEMAPYFQRGGGRSL